MKKNNCFKVYFFFILVCFIPTYSSATVIDIETEILTGVNGLVNVTEATDTTDIYYVVDIVDELSSINVAAFAVSTDSLDAIPQSNRHGWGAQRLNQSQWDLGSILRIGENNYNTIDFGLYESFFGDDLYALFYGLSLTSPTEVIFDICGCGPGAPITVQDDENYRYDNFAEFHLYQPPPENTGTGGEVVFTLTSDFVAFDLNGNIVDKSYQDVPEPSTLFIFVLGLLGMFFLKANIYNNSEFKAICRI